MKMHETTFLACSILLASGLVNSPIALADSPSLGTTYVTGFRPLWPEPAPGYLSIVLGHGGGPMGMVGRYYGADIPMIDSVEVIGVRLPPDKPNVPLIALSKYTKALPECDKAGNPVIFTTGDKVESDVDFITGGEMPLNLVRNYSHYSDGIGIFGKNWRSSFDYQLSFDSSLSSAPCYPEPGNLVACSSIPSQPSSIFLHRPDGAIVKFVWNATSSVWFEDRVSPVAKIVKEVNGTYTFFSSNGSVESYSNTGYVQKIQNDNGVSWTFSYTNNYLTKVQHSSGRAVNLTWSGNNLLSVTDPAGNVYSYTYLNNRFGANLHLLSGISRPGSPVSATTYHYEDSRYLGGFTGKSINGVRFSTFSYDAEKRANQSVHSGGVEKYTFLYTGNGSNITSALVTNPLGKKTTYSVSNGLITEVTGTASTYCPSSYKAITYDSNGFPDLQADFENGLTDLDYDSRGRLVKLVYKDPVYGDRVYNFTWDTGKNRVVKVVQVGVSEINFTYNSDNYISNKSITNLSSQGIANQTLSTSYSYAKHTNGLISTETIDGPLPGLSDSISRNFDSSGNMTTLTDANGVLVSYSNYNALGLPGIITSREGKSISYIYNASGRATSVSQTVNGQSVTLTLTYDGYGNITSETGPDGTLTYSYDAAGRMQDIVSDYETTGTAKVQTTTFNKKIFGYNLNSDLISYAVNRTGTTVVQNFQDGGSPTTTTNTSTFNSGFIDYDELGRVRTRRGNNNQNYVNTYDRESRIKTVKDAANNTTTLAYNALGDVVSSTDALGKITTFGYDAAGNMNKVTAPNGAITQYVYDGLGLLRQQISSDTGTTTYTYNTFGQVTQVSRANGASITNTYDAQGRISQIVAARNGLANVTRSFTYDNCVLGTGKLCAVVDSTGGTMGFAYNSQGLLASQSHQIGGNSYSTSWIYDAQGRVTQQMYPNGDRINVQYVT